MTERNSRRRCRPTSRRTTLPSSSLLLLFTALLAGPLLTSIPLCTAQRAAVGIGARLKKIVPGRRSESLHSKLVPDGESMNDDGGGGGDSSSLSDIPPTAMLLVTMVVGFLVSYLAAQMNGGRERSRIVLSRIAGKSSSDYSLDGRCRTMELYYLLTLMIFLQYQTSRGRRRCDHRRGRPYGCSYRKGRRWMGGYQDGP